MKITREQVYDWSLSTSHVLCLVTLLASSLDAPKRIVVGLLASMFTCILVSIVAAVEPGRETNEHQ